MNRRNFNQDNSHTIIFIGIDAQVDFIDGALPNEVAQGNVHLLSESAAAVREYQSTVFWTQDTHEHPDRYFNTLEGKYLPIPHCEYATPGWMIHPAIKRGPDDRYVCKGTFGSTNLVEELRFWGCDSTENNYPAIIMGGYDSDICGVSNALMLRATLPNTKMYWLAYASAGVTPESHQAALTVMKACQIEIVETYEDLVKILEEVGTKVPCDEEDKNND